MCVLHWSSWITNYCKSRQEWLAQAGWLSNFWWWLKDGGEREKEVSFCQFPVGYSLRRGMSPCIRKPGSSAEKQLIMIHSAEPLPLGAWWGPGSLRPSSTHLSLFFLLIPWSLYVYLLFFCIYARLLGKSNPGLIILISVAPIDIYGSMASASICIKCRRKYKYGLKCAQVAVILHYKLYCVENKIQRNGN